MGKKAHQNLLRARAARAAEAAQGPYNNTAQVSEAVTTSKPVTKDQAEVAANASVISNFKADESADILSMSSIERKALGQGPRVKIFEGDELVMDMPRRLFMAATTKASELLDGSGEVHLPEKTGKDAIQYLVGWLNMLTEKAYVSRLTKKYELSENLKLCRAGRLLGMEMYVKDIHKFCWAFLINQKPKSATVMAVEDVAQLDEDPFVKCLAKRLAYMYRDDEMQNPENFFEFIKDYPVMKAAFDEENKPNEEYKARVAKREKKEADLKAKEAKQEARLEAQEKRAAKAADPRLIKNALLKESVTRKLKDKIRTFTLEELEYVKFHKIPI